MEGLAGGYVTQADIRRVLAREYDLTVKMI